MSCKLGIQTKDTHTGIFVKWRTPRLLFVLKEQIGERAGSFAFAMLLQFIGGTKQKELVR